MDINPKISIIIPVYNGANYLKEAIESALAQTYPNFEIIVVNDGSTDGGKTEKIALSYRDKIRYFAKENGGVASALNLGITEAQGDYISWLSHDDMYLPQKLERQVAYLKQHNSADKLILYSDFEAVDLRHETSYVITIQPVRASSELYNTLCLLFGAVLHGCTLLLPKSCFTDVGLFREDLRTTQDYEFWFRLAKKNYVFVHIPEVLIQTRWHEEQGTHAMSDIHCREVEELYIQAFDLFCEEFKAFSFSQVADLVMVLRDKTLQKSPEYILRNLARNKLSCMILVSVMGLKRFKRRAKSRLGFFIRWRGRPTGDVAQI